MKARISISAAIIIYALVTAVGLFSVLFTSGYALQQLRIGSPLYTQIKLGNDLVADILPPPEYVLEAYLEATLAVRDPSTVTARRDRLVQLHKDYDERREYWIKSDLEQSLKSKLTKASDAEVQRFWTIIEQEMLPALEKKNAGAAETAYAKLDPVYAAHRAIIDDIVKQTNDENAALETTAAQRVTSFSYIVWSVSGGVVLIIALGILGIALGVIRPVVPHDGGHEAVGSGRSGCRDTFRRAQRRNRSNGTGRGGLQNQHDREREVARAPAPIG